MWDLSTDATLSCVKTGIQKGMSVSGLAIIKGLGKRGKTKPNIYIYIYISIPISCISFFFSVMFQIHQGSG